MQLGEIFSFLDTRLARPELYDYTRYKAIAALRKLHSSLNFENNYVEWVVQNTALTPDATNPNKGKFTYSDDCARPHLLRAYDSTNTLIGTVDILAPSELDKRQRSNISVLNTAYRNGQNSISYNCSAQPYYFVLTGFTYRPEFAITTNADGSSVSLADTSVLTYHDWMLDIYPDIVMDYVIGFVAALVGEKEISNAHLSVYRTEHLSVLRSLAMHGHN